MGRLQHWLDNRALAHSSPFLMVFFLVLSSWANLYQLCWLRLINPSDKSFDLGLVFAGDRTVGFPLLIMSTLLKATWFGAWVQILVITWFVDRKWKPPRSSRNIMQLDASVWYDAMESSRGWWIPYDEERRPRQCIHPACKARLSDRVYHCTRLGRDLPLYDHYCTFLKAAVYLRTIKAYLSVILGAILAMLRGVPSWILGFKYDERGETRLHLQRFEGRHPWDLGISENLHQVLGRHWWQWFFFWWQPERVSRYGKYAGRDLPYADWVIRYRTDLLMAPLVHVAIDDGPGASPSHGQARVHRRLQRSTRSSSHAEEPAYTSAAPASAAPASAAPAPPAPAPPAPTAARSGRRRFEFSFGSSTSSQ
ncbi:hypothetical protein DL769_004562 [Monosporascus sp. CRB-8-3]|nr:hypothetical protein DL769_004562 [Monosporascus sp. CRB-8-3]